MFLALYAATVAVMGQFAAIDSASLGYPSALWMLTSASAFSLALAVLMIAFKWHPKELIAHWKVIYWLSCMDLAIGLYMDATEPRDFNITDASWLRIASLVLAIVLPAYICSYLVAYRSRRCV